MFHLAWPWCISLNLFQDYNCFPLSSLLFTNNQTHFNTQFQPKEPEKVMKKIHNALRIQRNGLARLYSTPVWEDNTFSVCFNQPFLYWRSAKGDLIEGK